MTELAALLLIFAVLFGSTGMMAMFGYLVSKVRRLEAGTRADGDSGLLDELRTTHSKLAKVQRDLDALAEQVEFTERLLSDPSPATARRASGETERGS